MTSPDDKPQRFRKKPVTVDARQWLGGEYEWLNDFCGRNWARADAVDVPNFENVENVVLWNTAERQWLQCPVGHWIIRGVQGELYPCKPDIFAATYEPASFPSAQGREQQGSVELGTLRKLLRDVQDHAAIGEPGWDELERRISAMLVEIAIATAGGASVPNAEGTIRDGIEHAAAIVDEMQEAWHDSDEDNSGHYMDAADRIAKVLMERALNATSAENTSNTPDFVLGGFLMSCLQAFDQGVNARSKWYGRADALGQSAPSAIGTPAEPTPAMQQAGVRELRNGYWVGTDYARVCAIYHAMLEAAPSHELTTQDAQAGATVGGTTK